MYEDQMTKSNWIEKQNSFDFQQFKYNIRYNVEW